MGAQFLSSTGLGSGNLIGRAQLPPAPALDKKRSPIPQSTLENLPRTLLRRVLWYGPLGGHPSAGILRSSWEGEECLTFQNFVRKLFTETLESVGFVVFLVLFVA